MRKACALNECIASDAKKNRFDGLLLQNLLQQLQPLSRNKSHLDFVGATKFTESSPLSIRRNSRKALEFIARENLAVWKRASVAGMAHAFRRCQKIKHLPVDKQLSWTVYQHASATELSQMVRQLRPKPSQWAACGWWARASAGVIFR